MHSREGLETEYMSTEWMDCVKATVKAAKEEGMAAWLYDEDRFPSGAAGGLVPAKGGDAFRSKALMLEIIKEDFAPDDKIAAVFEAVVEGDNILQCRRLEMRSCHSLTKDTVFLVFRYEVSGSNEWYNDDAPADNLNPDAVAAFIESTHEVYKREIGDEFGKTVPGIFTDEPNIADFISVYSDRRVWIPWTTGFGEYFEKVRGYDILDVVPYIFFQGEKSAKARHDYWRTISDRFCEVYSKQISEWCEKNNLAYTGHYFEEDHMGCAVRANGSVMPHYRYQHIPGIDILKDRTNEYLTVKQCTSVANQYGRKHVLSETYGCTGWDFTFEGQKWIGDWQFVMGVTLRCQHLALYSLKGCRKRDYPPAFSYNNSWFKYNKVVEDYFARLSAVLTEGSVVRDILVIHPVSTVWSMLGRNPYRKQESGWWADPETNEPNKFGDRFNDFVRSLLAFHYDPDLGDETIIAEKGRVEGGKFWVNHVGYSVVILPPMKTLLESTVRLLEEFMKTGGKVIAVEPLATLIEGEEANLQDKLYKNENLLVAGDLGSACRLLESTLPRKVSICNRFMAEAPEFLYMQRDLPDSQILFVVSNDRKNTHEVMITVSCTGRVEEWDALTGRFNDVDASINRGNTVFTADFSPAGSRLFIIHKNEALKLAELRFKYSDDHFEQKKHTALGPVCSFTRTMPNVLVLDKCSARINEGDWSEITDVWKAQREIRETLGMRQVYYNGLPQRYKWIDKPHPSDGTMVQFMFQFHVNEIPQSDIYLVIEEAELFKVDLNGKEIGEKPDGWFVDKSFGKIKLYGLKKGMNELVLTCKYMNRMEVEDCYLIGDFGVDINRNIISEPKSLHLGDWCMQGYFHYCGSMIYHFDVKFDKGLDQKAVLEIGEYSAVTVEVKINGRSAGHIPWPQANKLDMTDFLRDGVNKIDIEVMGSPRNMFGPLHHKLNNIPGIDWSCFRTEGEYYTPEYVVKPYGLMGQINILSSYVHT